MKELYTSNGMLCERYETVAEAILDTVRMWHESSLPEAYVVRDEENMIAATIAPVGSDKAIIVYAHGQVDTYDGITYVTEEGKLIGTRCYYNGSATPTFLAHTI